MSDLLFTKIRDVDIKMLQELDDHDLYDVCLVNKYAASLCNDENFWRNRFMINFGPDILSGKPSDISWKNYYIELANFEELTGKDRLYYITPSAKLFFNSIDLGDYSGRPLNVNLIEKAGVSSKNNLKKLLTYYSYKQLGFGRFDNPNLEFDFGNIFDIEHERLRIVDKKLSDRNIDKLIPLLIAKHLKPNTLLYSKMYNLYKKEKVILSELKY